MYHTSIFVFLEVGWTKGIFTYCIINTRIYVFFVLLHFKVLSSKLLIIAFNCCQQAAPTTKIILHIKEVFFLRPLHFIFISYWKFSGIIWSCPFFSKTIWAIDGTFEITACFVSYLSNFWTNVFYIKIVSISSLEHFHFDT